uniref:Uncharacterized protein n=1 Tax=Sparus aurata TaxID=8175 RepID=A0A671TQL5_SPAAU
MYSRILIPALLLVVGLATVFAQTTAPGIACEAKNGTSCEQCLNNVTCLWCIKTKSCVTYPVRTILPPHSLCPLNDARWGLCWMNFQALIITLAVVGGIIIIAALVCLFCCCKCENFGAQLKLSHYFVRQYPSPHKQPQIHKVDLILNFELASGPTSESLHTSQISPAVQILKNEAKQNRNSF